MLAGSTHTTYCKTLQNALGMKANVFYGKMYPVVKSMVDDLCEVAKREMKGKSDGDLGSWNRAVTTADGTWQTRGWHSENATFTIRNYLNGALLYYHHLCQKGRDKIVEGGLYPGTSKSAEGYAARITFQRAKEEGMDVAIHWQDADSSSSKAVREIFPKAELCTPAATQDLSLVCHSNSLSDSLPHWSTHKASCAPGGLTDSILEDMTTEAVQRSRGRYDSASQVSYRQMPVESESPERL